MSIKLPKLIDAFVQAKNDRNSEELAACFSDNAVVYDEGQEICGIAAIKKWIDDNHKKYQVTLNVMHFMGRADESILMAKVSGNFTGSPVLLTFHFRLDEDKISMLRISLTKD